MSDIEERDSIKKYEGRDLSGSPETMTFTGVNERIKAIASELRPDLVQVAVDLIKNADHYGSPIYNLRVNIDSAVRGIVPELARLPNIDKLPTKLLVKVMVRAITEFVTQSDFIGQVQTGIQLERKAPSGVSSDTITPQSNDHAPVNFDFSTEVVPRNLRDLDDEIQTDSESLGSLQHIPGFLLENAKTHDTPIYNLRSNFSEAINGVISDFSNEKTGQLPSDLLALVMVRSILLQVNNEKFLKSIESQIDAIKNPK